MGLTSIGVTEAVLLVVKGLRSRRDLCSSMSAVFRFGRELGSPSSKRSETEQDRRVTKSTGRCAGRANRVLSQPRPFIFRAIDAGWVDGAEMQLELWT